MVQQHEGTTDWPSPKRVPRTEVGIPGFEQRGIGQGRSSPLEPTSMHACGCLDLSGDRPKSDLSSDRYVAVGPTPPSQRIRDPHCAVLDLILRQPPSHLCTTADAPGSLPLRGPTPTCRDTRRRRVRVRTRWSWRSAWKNCGGRGAT